MKLVEICLQSERGDEELRLRLPAGYLGSIIRDGHGRAVFVNVTFVLPNYDTWPTYLREARTRVKPAMATKNPDIVHINLSGEIATDGDRYESNRLGHENQYEQLTSTIPGLVHFTSRRCEELRVLRESNRPMESRRCEKGIYGSDTYYGRSERSQKTVIITCYINNVGQCNFAAWYRDRQMNMPLVRTELHRWREFEGIAMEFLDKYFSGSTSRGVSTQEIKKK